MTQNLICLILVLAVAVIAWNLALKGTWGSVKKPYRLTGYIGAPLYRCTQALACIISGINITSFSIYKANDDSAEMGTLSILYKLYSPAHIIGLALQVVAPVAVGTALVCYLVGGPVIVSDGGWGEVLSTATTLKPAYELAVSGPLGALTLLLATIIAMHSIPKVFDIMIGLRGLVVLAILLFACTIAFDFWKHYQADIGANFGYVLARVLTALSNGLLIALSATVTMVTLSLAGMVCLVVLPAMVLSGFGFVRGAPGKA